VQAECGGGGVAEGAKSGNGSVSSRFRNALSYSGGRASRPGLGFFHRIIPAFRGVHGKVGLS
jgi:hypothetical protein